MGRGERKVLNKWKRGRERERERERERRTERHRVRQRQRGREGCWPSVHAEVICCDDEVFH